jgi:replicative DNA helicase
MSKIGPVDDLLLGFRPGKLYILAARPGLGKSMLALQIATQCGQQVANYSMEMLATEQVERMVSQECDLNSENLRSETVLLAKGKLLADVVVKLGKLPIWFCDESPITPAQILSQCRRLKKKSGLGLIVVDYLQLIKGIGKFERRDLEVGSISKALKSISMKLEVPVLTIASLSRKPEERTDKRPLLSDLRESGDIESDADCVMFLYRESDYNNEAKKLFPNVTELIVSKNRGGKKGRSILNFDGAHSKFYPLHQIDTTGYLNFLDPKKVNHDQQARNGGSSKKISGSYSSFMPD